MYHDFSCGTTTGCSAGCCLQRTTLTIPFMQEVAKAYIRGACAEIREDGETSPRAGAFRLSRDEEEVVGRSNENRRRHEQGIAVGARDRVPAAG